MEKLNSFQQAIKAYLDERNKTDELFSKAYSKPNKSLKECCDYIMGEAKKRGSAVCISDNEVFGMAVHYYDEDNLKINKVSGDCKVSVPKPEQKVNLTDEDRKVAHEAAIKRLAEEQYQSLRKKPAKKKEASEVQQMSLF